MTNTNTKTDTPIGDGEFHEATTLDERFKKMEMRTLTAIILALFPTLMLPPIIAQFASASKSAVQTKEVTLTDKNGQAQARIDLADDGAVRISILDADAQVKSTMKLATGDTPRIVLANRAGEVVFSTPLPDATAPKPPSPTATGN